MVRIDKAELEPFVATLLRRLSVPDEDADVIAHSLVLADRRSHSSHGVFRIPRYWDMANDGAIEPTATPIIVEETATMAIVDGRSAFGQLVGWLATSLAIEKASTQGVAVINVRDGSHLGRIGEWAERATEAGFCFIAFVNLQGGSSYVAPVGSADRRLGTNPIAFGMPSFDALSFPIVLDVATSQIAHGKTREYARTDQDLPDKWTTTNDGKPVRDTKAFEDGIGAMLPLGGQSTGYKEFGLAVFAGVLSGGKVAGQTSHDYFSNAATMIAIDPGRFLPQSAVTERVAALASHLRSADYTTGVSAGISAGPAGSLLGEPEHEAMLVSDKEGVMLSQQTADSLRDPAWEHDITRPEAIHR